MYNKDHMNGSRECLKRVAGKRGENCWPLFLWVVYKK
jgi:hypothetical protein